MGVQVSVLESMGRQRISVRVTNLLEGSQKEECKGAKKAEVVIFEGGIPCTRQRGQLGGWEDAWPKCMVVHSFQDLTDASLGSVINQTLSPRTSQYTLHDSTVVI